MCSDQDYVDDYFSYDVNYDYGNSSELFNSRDTNELNCRYSNITYQFKVYLYTNFIGFYLLPVAVRKLLSI